MAAVGLSLVYHRLIFFFAAGASGNLPFLLSRRMLLKTGAWEVGSQVPFCGYLAGCVPIFLAGLFHRTWCFCAFKSRHSHLTKLGQPISSRDNHRG